MICCWTALLSVGQRFLVHSDPDSALLSRVSSNCSSSPRFVVQVEKSVARGSGGIYLGDPTPPGGVVRISGPSWTTCQRLFCSTRLLPENHTQSAKRLADAEVSTLHSAIKQGHSLRCSPALFLKHLPAPLSALPYRRRRFKLLTPFSCS